MIVFQTSGWLSGDVIGPMATLIGMWLLWGAILKISQMRLDARIRSRIVINDNDGKR